MSEKEHVWSLLLNTFFFIAWQKLEKTLKNYFCSTSKMVRILRHFQTKALRHPDLTKICSFDSDDVILLDGRGMHMHVDQKQTNLLIRGGKQNKNLWRRFGQ